MQPSQHYGGFGGQLQQNVFSINAAQVRDDAHQNK